MVSYAKPGNFKIKFTLFVCAPVILLVLMDYKSCVLYPFPSYQIFNLSGLNNAQPRLILKF